MTAHYHMVFRPFRHVIFHAHSDRSRTSKRNNITTASIRTHRYIQFIFGGEYYRRVSSTVMYHIYILLHALPRTSNVLLEKNKVPREFENGSKLILRRVITKVPMYDKFCAKRCEDSNEIYTTESSPRWDYTVSLAVQCPFDPTDPREAS